MKKKYVCINFFLIQFTYLYMYKLCVDTYVFSLCWCCILILNRLMFLEEEEKKRSIFDKEK